MVRFADVVDMADRLTLEERETLAELLRTRAAQERRRQIIADTKEANREFRAGKCKVVTPAQLIREILR